MRTSNRSKITLRKIELRFYSLEQVRLYLIEVRIVVRNLYLAFGLIMLIP